MAELEAALNVHKPRGVAGMRVTMLHEAFSFTAAGNDGGGAPCLQRLLPALDTVLGAERLLPPHAAVAARSCVLSPCPPAWLPARLAAARAACTHFSTLRVWKTTESFSADNY